MSTLPDQPNNIQQPTSLATALSGRTLAEQHDLRRRHLYQPGWDAATSHALHSWGADGGELLYLLCLAPARQPALYEDLFYQNLILTLRAVNAGVPLTEQARPLLLEQLLAAQFAISWQANKPAYRLVGWAISSELESLSDPALVEALITVMLGRLAEANEDVRRAALRTLGWLQVDQPTVVDSLLMRLHNETNIHIRSAVIDTLVRVAESNPTVTAALADQLQHEQDSHLMESLAWAVAEPTADETSVVAPILRHIQSEQEGHDRNCAIYALHNALGQLAATPPEATTELLYRLAHDEDGGVRYAAAGALAEVEPTAEVVDALFHALYDDDMITPGVAVDSLLSFGTAGVLPRLLSILRYDEAEDARQTIIERLVQVGAGDDEFKQVLLEIVVADDSLDVVNEAANALRNLVAGDVAVASYLIDLLGQTVATAEDKLASYRPIALVQVLAGTGLRSNAATAVLLALLTDNNTYAYDFEPVAYALGEVGSKSPEGVAALVQGLAADDARLSGRRRGAVDALGSLGVDDPATVAVLVERLEQDSDEYTRSRAATVLGSLAAGRAEVVAALSRAATQDTEVVVQVAAVEALAPMVGSSAAVVATLRAVMEQAAAPAARLNAALLLVNVPAEREAAREVLYDLARLKDAGWSYGIGDVPDVAFTTLYQSVVGEVNTDRE